MNEEKVNYGIDLGTTNSAICRVENGRPRIIKSDQNQKDTTPSCVSINKKQICNVGDRAIADRKKIYLKLANDPDAKVDDSFIEFKRAMGSDKVYESRHLGRSLSPEALSAEVLKKLKSYVTDDDVRAAVITIPAKFTAAQVDATRRAAELAGFQYAELLQEPIAASIAYGIKAETIDGYWLVFDFGGGTFDAALMSVEDGIMKVRDTEGDNFLGGKNIDEQLTNEIIIPVFKSEHPINSRLDNDAKKYIIDVLLKEFAERAKIDLSSNGSVYLEILLDTTKDDDGEEVDFDFTIQLSDFEETASPLFQSAIDIAKALIKRNHLSSSDLKTVVLVGGPTFSKTFRRMLKEQLDCPVDISMDPMTCVAEGAAMFASTRNLPDDLKVRDETRIQLKLTHEASSVEVEGNVAVVIDEEHTTGAIPEKLFIEIKRHDEEWASGRSEVTNGSEVVFVSLAKGKTNTFDICLYDEQGTSIPCQPATFSILQGVKIAAATMPYSVGLATTDSNTGKGHVDFIEGLWKNQELPAKGRGYWKTPNDIRPGNSDDILNFRIIDGEYHDEGANPDWCTLKADGQVSGEDLSGFVPEGSEVEVTIKIDASQNVSGSAFFKHSDDDVDIQFKQFTNKTPDKSYLGVLIKRGQGTLAIDENNLLSSQEDNVKKLDGQLNDLNAQLNAGGDDDDMRQQVNSNVKKILKEIDRLQEKAEWPKVLEDIRQELKRLDDVQAQYGDEKTREHVNELKSRAETIMAEEDAKMGKKLMDDMGGLQYSLLRQDPNFFIGIISNIDRSFDMYDWKNTSQARQIIETAKRSIAARDFTVESLSDQLGGIYDCMKDPRKVQKELVDKSRPVRID